MKNKKKLVIVLILLLAVAAAVLVYLKEENQAPGDILTIYGNVDIRQVELAFYDEGRIKTMLVDEGQKVKAGQLLAEIDPVRLQAEVKRLEGEVAAQQQVVNRLHAGS
ncbi:MAG: hemolysin D, partial [Thermodesulfatator sp.]